MYQSITVYICTTSPYRTSYHNLSQSTAQVFRVSSGRLTLPAFAVGVLDMESGIAHTPAHGAPLEQPQAGLPGGRVALGLGLAGM